MTTPSIDQEFLKSLTVLYVEDEDDIFEPGVRLISRYCATLLTARNGQEGLDVFIARSPDLIITDIKMPTMDGLQLLQEIRKTGTKTDVILVTAYGEVESYLKAMSLGAAEYINKPIRIKELKRIVHKVLTEQRARSGN